MLIRAALVIACCLVVAAPATTAAQESTGFVDSDGSPLPFASHEEAVQFLRTARVIEEEALGLGTTGVRRIVLEKDGVRADAVFRHVDSVARDARVAGRRFREFHDSYQAECAAHALSRLLELGNVPPTVCRPVDGRDGSIQLWMHGTMTEAERIERDSRPPDGLAWTYEKQTMYLFDNLVFNDDRNRENMLIDSQWRIWMIDHSRAFQHLRELRDPGRLSLIERGVWERLELLDDETLSDAVAGYLDPEQMAGLRARLDLVLDHVEELIAERGEGAVVYEKDVAG